jgi:hypothetical protein
MPTTPPRDAPPGAALQGLFQPMERCHTGIRCRPYAPSNRQITIFAPMPESVLKPNYWASLQPKTQDVVITSEAQPYADRLGL